MYSKLELIDTICVIYLNNFSSIFLSNWTTQSSNFKLPQIYLKFWILSNNTIPFLSLPRSSTHTLCTLNCENFRGSAIIRDYLIYLKKKHSFSFYCTVCFIHWKKSKGSKFCFYVLVAWARRRVSAGDTIFFSFFFSIS